MSDKTIDALTASGDIAGADLFPALQDGDSEATKVAASKFLKYILSARNVRHAVDYGLETASSGFTEGSDNVTAIENAISALDTAGGGVLVLPSGRIPLSAKVTVTQNNIVICGAGTNATFIVKDSSDNTSYVFEISGTDCAVMDFCIDGESATGKTGRWNQVWFTGDRARAERIRGVNAPSPILGYSNCDYYHAEHIYGDNITNAIIAVNRCNYGYIEDVKGYNCWELVDFGGQADELSKHATLINCHGLRTSDVDEEAFDLGGVAYVKMYNCSCDGGYLNGAVIKTEPSVDAETTQPFGKIVMVDCDFLNVRSYGVTVNMYSNGVADFTPQGPVELIRVKATVKSGATPESFVYYNVEGDAGDYTTGLGLKLVDCRCEDFDYVIAATGLANRFEVRGLYGTGLVGFFDTASNLSGDSGDAQDWILRDVDIDCGFYIDSRHLDGLDVDGMKCVAGARNGVDYALKIERVSKVKIRHLYGEGFDHAGVSINHFTSAQIDADYWQDVFVDDVEIRNCAQENGGETTPAGVLINFSSGSTASQTIHGVTVTNVRVYSDASDYMENVIELYKGDFDAIDGAILSGIGVGVTTGIRGSGDLGSNVVTDVVVV